MTRFDVLTVSNAVADLIAPVAREELARFHLEPGSSLLCSHDQQSELFDNIHFSEVVFQGGGSLINSARVLARQEGGSSCVTGLVGRDHEGHKYIQSLEDIGVIRANDFMRETGLPTGKSLIFVTSDGERTIRTYLGASSALRPDDLNAAAISESQWVFIEGYLLGNQQNGQDTVFRAIELAKAAGKKIAFSLSDAFIPEHFPEATEAVVAQIDLLIGNRKEACALTKAESWEQAFRMLELRGLDLLISNGAEGVRIAFGKERDIFVPALKNVKVVDTTGAGDALAGGFLYGITHNMSPASAAELGCKLAAKVISHVGADLSPAIELDSF